MDIVKEDNDGISNTIFAALKQELCLSSWSDIIYCDISWPAQRVRYMACQLIGNIRIPSQCTFVAHAVADVYHVYNVYYTIYIYSMIWRLSNF